LALVFSASATAAIDDGTAHDLRTRLSINQVCLPCHAPHNALNADDGPIWNHAVTTQTFTRNGDTVTLGESSKLCLSCHDGVTAVGSYGSVIGSDPITGSAAIGNNLTDDHPIGIDYPVGSHIYVDPTTDTTVAGMLEDGKVECGSCHRAHSAGVDGKYLRVTIVDSALCRTCHTF